MTLLAVFALILSMAACSGTDEDTAAGDEAPEGGGIAAEPTTTTTTETEVPTCDPATTVAAWPLRERVAQLVMVGVDPSGPSDAREAVVDHRIGGIFVGGNDTALFDGDLVTLAAEAEVTPFVAVDEEGGRVQRIDALEGPIPSARRMAAELTPDEVKAIATERAAALAEAGVNVDLAPVVDVSDQPASTVIGDRSFSADPVTAAAYADAFAKGLRAHGVLPVFKHFPGHGRASGDTHEGAARTPSIEELRAVDLAPYVTLLDDRPAAVMVGHLDVPGQTGGVPASISPAIVDGLLRSEVGWEGLVISDDLEGMGAITDSWALPEAAEAAIVAGSDIALIASTGSLDDVLDRLEDAVETGRIPEDRLEQSLGRILDAKGFDPCA